MENSELMNISFPYNVISHTHQHVDKTYTLSPCLYTICSLSTFSFKYVPPPPFPNLHRMPGPPYPGPPPRAPNKPLDQTRIHPSSHKEVFKPAPSEPSGVEEKDEKPKKSKDDEEKDEKDDKKDSAQQPTIIVVQQPAVQYPPLNLMRGSYPSVQEIEPIVVNLSPDKAIEKHEQSLNANTPYKNVESESNISDRSGPVNTLTSTNIISKVPPPDRFLNANFPPRIANRRYLRPPHRRLPNGHTRRGPLRRIPLHRDTLVHNRIQGSGERRHSGEIIEEIDLEEEPIKILRRPPGIIEGKQDGEETTDSNPFMINNKDYKDVQSIIDEEFQNEFEGFPPRPKNSISYPPNIFKTKSILSKNDDDNPNTVYVEAPPTFFRTEDNLNIEPKSHPIRRPPPQHKGVNIPGVSHPQDSGSIQDIINKIGRRKDGPANHNMNTRRKPPLKRHDDYNHAFVDGIPIRNPDSYDSSFVNQGPTRGEDSYDGRFVEGNVHLLDNIHYNPGFEGSQDDYDYEDNNDLPPLNSYKPPRRKPLKLPPSHPKPSPPSEPYKPINYRPPIGHPPKSNFESAKVQPKQPYQPKKVNYNHQSNIGHNHERYPSLSAEHPQFPKSPYSHEDEDDHDVLKPVFQDTLANPPGPDIFGNSQLNKDHSPFGSKTGSAKFNSPFSSDFAGVPGGRGVMHKISQLSQTIPSGPPGYQTVQNRPKKPKYQHTDLGNPINPSEYALFAQPPQNVDELYTTKNINNLKNRPDFQVKNKRPSIDYNLTPPNSHEESHGFEDDDEVITTYYDMNGNVIPADSVLLQGLTHDDHEESHVDHEHHGQYGPGGGHGQHRPSHPGPRPHKPSHPELKPHFGQRPKPHHRPNQHRPQPPVPQHNDYQHFQDEALPHYHDTHDAVTKPPSLSTEDYGHDSDYYKQRPEGLPEFDSYLHGGKPKPKAKNKYKFRPFGTKAPEHPPQFNYPSQNYEPDDHFMRPDGPDYTTATHIGDGIPLVGDSLKGKSKKPVNIALDVYPMTEHEVIKRKREKGRHGTNKHELLLHLNLFSKKPAGSADSKLQLGPFSYDFDR